MFELDQKTKSKLASINLRSERHGDDLVPAVDLKFTIDASNDILTSFDGHLKSSLYFKSAASSTSQGELDGVDPVSDQPNLRFPKLGPLRWEDERTGYTLTIDHGMGGKSDLVLESCSVNNFSITPKEGGTVELSFRVQAIHVKEKEMGRLATLVQHDLEISLTAPDIEES